MQKLIKLTELCNEIERSMIKRMIHNAAEYVRAVVIMETAACNIAGLDAAEAREAKESTDRARTLAHDAFISSVNSVNRICERRGVPPIYDGGCERREYGDFAIALVDEIFTKRN